jgi:hypothetical protein
VRTAPIREELERLAALYGGQLRPDVVVAAARDETSPLHDSFEWDDSEAAEHWRLHQARMLIRAVVTYEPAKNGSMVPQRVFVSLTSDREKDGAGYRLTSAVLSDEDRRVELLRDARAEMLSFREKYRRLSELADVFTAMEAVEERVSEPMVATA